MTLFRRLRELLRDLRPAQCSRHQAMMEMARMALRVNEATPAQIARAMETMPPETREFGERFEALGRK